KTIRQRETKAQSSAALKLVHVRVGSDWFAGALRQGFVFLNEALCDCARFAGADDAAIDFHDGDDLGARAGEEEFVGVEKIIARQVRLADRNSRLAREIDDHTARNAVKRAG